MLSEKFLTRLSSAFPSFYEEVDAQAMEDAARLRRDAGGDLERALVRARFEGAARLWWPYVKGTVPLVGDKRAAMREFSRLVLTVDHLVGYKPQGMEDARRQVVEVLRNSVDVERLKRLVEKQEAEKAAKGAAAGAGVAASLTALLSPVAMLRSARKWYKLMPPPIRATMGAVLVAALLSVPFVAGYSAGHEAEKAARNYGELPAGEDEEAEPARERRQATA